MVKPTAASDIAAENIISFHSGEMLVAHRVIEVIDGSEAPMFRTKGDANEEADRSLVPAANVVGKVVFSVPLAGYLAGFIKTRLGFLLATVVPGAAIVALEMKSLWRIALRGDTADPA